MSIVCLDAMRDGYVVFLSNSMQEGFITQVLFVVIVLEMYSHSILRGMHNTSLMLCRIKFIDTDSSVVAGWMTWGYSPYALRWQRLSLSSHLASLRSAARP